MPKATAAHFRPLTIEQLAVRADAVVHARVESLESARDAESRIFTKADLKVIEVWKGTVRSDVCQVVSGGGVLGETSVSAIGQVAYNVGEEVVAYLVRNPAGEWVTLGLSQGQFRVRVEPATGRRWVHNRFWGETTSVTAMRAGRVPTERPRDLDELKRRTQEARQ